MSVILARSTGGKGASVIPAISVSIPASATQTVDAVSTILNRTVKWLVTVTDSTNNKVVAYEVFATHRGGANPVHTRYAVIGDATITHVVDVAIAGTDLELRITNNETVALVVDAVRLQVAV